MYGSVQATDRLMKELRDIYKSESYKNGGYSVELVDDSIYEWNVNLHHIDPDSDLYKDLQKFQETNGRDGIILNFRFKETFPFEAPFVRVVSPVIKGVCVHVYNDILFLNSKCYMFYILIMVGGYVMPGGAICLELLTSDGWSSVYTVEAIIMQISSSLVKGKGRIPLQNKVHDQITV